MAEKSVAILHLPAGRQVWHDWRTDRSRKGECLEDIQEKEPLADGRERKRKNLICLGVKEGVAYAWSRIRRGGWAIGQSPILGTTIKVSLLKRKGYISLIDYYSKVGISI